MVENDVNTTLKTLPSEGMLYRFVPKSNAVIRAERPRISLFPNPASLVLTIENIEKQEDLNIYNQMGQQMEISLISPNKIDISNYSPGIYFLSTFNTIGKFATLFIKE